MAKQDRRKSAFEMAAAAVGVFMVGIILSLTAADLEKSARAAEKESVSAAITFSPPEETEEKGFWDIFFESVSHMFSGGV